MSQAEIAKVLGKPQTYVSKHMRLLDAPEVVKSLLKDKVTKDLDMVYTLSQISDINPDRAEKMVELLRDGKLTRGSAIKELNLLKGKPVVPPKSAEQDNQGSDDQQDSGEDAGVSTGTHEPAKAATVYPGSNDNGDRQPEKAESNSLEKDALPDTAGQPVVSSRPATVDADRDEQQPESVKRDDHPGEEQAAPGQSAALAASQTVTPAGTTRRIMVMVDGEEGYMVTDKTPDEFGLVWIKLKIGEVCIEAKDVTVLGIKEV